VGIAIYPAAALAEVIGHYREKLVTRTTI